MQYIVTIEEYLSKDVCVEAPSKDEALYMVRKAYKKAEIVLSDKELDKFQEEYVGIHNNIDRQIKKYKIKIEELRKSEKSTIEGKEIILSNNDFIKYKEKDNEKKAINNNKESYYRIEKLPKEDKGKKGGKNLFLNDSLKGSKKNKNNEYLETENTTTDTSLEKKKNVTEFLQRAQKIKDKGYN